VRGYNFIYSDSPKKQITEYQIILSYDLSSFFELYKKDINAAGIGKRAGMKKSLISEYVNGKRKASPKQVGRIITAVKQLGREPQELEFVVPEQV
jgi:predicted transcriptional regulator